MSIKNVALVGASGHLGPSILKAFKASSTLTPFVINRKSSKSVYPGTNVITVPDDLNVSELAKLFNEHAIDAVVTAIAGSLVDEQRKFIDAAFQSNVKRVIPADFGSCDSADELTNQILPLMDGKRGVREYLISLQERDREGREKLTWTSLVTGHFFDWGLGSELLKFDVKNRKVYVLDGGDIYFSNSTLDFIADATVRVLERPKETANKLLYVHSHHVTQNQITEVLEKVTGDKFEKIPQDSQKLLEVARPKMLEGDFDAREEVVAVHGIVASDWADRETFANDLLGLKLQGLEEVVREVVKAVG
ncbi:NAD(P)-binding protein [Aaosphaeria arxii CBS 175.79]|uniref:NAD(P)-binding protein n=1 Tax=Aaosphaeria arxii CBS 175.79 TaxID=1450172 RepID=A0A6A5Y7L3_9PLEO|nr:NAD(P)-binding protein [Aaosphaeria arxii CBS 175.79]KAF2021518.1 NAD(P)-binding protein [Aaosphaeria arxii CBS 175.79]